MKTKKMEDFEKVFDTFCKNRQALCNEEGKIKSENVRFMLKYSALANEVAVKATEVVREDFDTKRIPEYLYSGALEMWENENSSFGKILIKGTLEEFYSALKNFHEKVIDYCFDNYRG